MRMELNELLEDGRAAPKSGGALCIEGGGRCSFSVRFVEIGNRTALLMLVIACDAPRGVRKGNPCEHEGDHHDYRQNPDNPKFQGINL